MKNEKPILFSTPMVQAILSNRKLQTRRVCGNGLGFGFITKDARGRTNGAIRYNDLSFVKENELPRLYQNCPYGQVGDLLWVRETFGKHIGKHEKIDTYSFKADNFHTDYPQVPEENKVVTLSNWYDEDLANETKWKPSIHMPKKVARIWLEITDIKIERLKDISEEDAKAEGVLPVENCYKNYLCKDTPTTTNSWYNPISSFLTLWESINGEESRKSNPWVWVITFKKVAKP